MNYSIRMLKWAVFLCLGFVSIAAWAVDTDYNDELIEKAWSCEPVLNSNWIRYMPLSIIDFVGSHRGHKQNICSDSGGPMRSALLQKYFIFRWAQERYINGVKVIEPEEQGDLNEYLKKSKRGGYQGYGKADLTGYDSRLFDEEKKRRDQKAREQEAVQAASEKKHQEQLKSGAVLVSNFQDAVLLHTPTSDLTNLMVSPLLKPDKSIYSGRVMLDAEDGDNLLRAKLNLSLLGGGIYYAHLQLTKKTVDFSSSMRIGATVNVMGRYVKNRKYTTIAGEEKTMPVLEVMYIGN